MKLYVSQYIKEGYLFKAIYFTHQSVVASLPKANLYLIHHVA